MENTCLPKVQRTSLCALGFSGALMFGVLPIERWLIHGDSMPVLLAREVIWWCMALAILLWLTRVERRPLSSIGFRHPTWKGAAFGLLTAMAVTLIMVLHFAVVIPFFHLSGAASLSQQQAILKTPYWYRVLLVLRAAVVEEIIFRAYLIEKCRELFGSTFLAVIVSTSAFTFAHLHSWGAVQLIPVAASGVVFALLYVWRKDLPSNMFGHFLADGLGFLTR